MLTINAMLEHISGKLFRAFMRADMHRYTRYVPEDLE